MKRILLLLAVLSMNSCSLIFEAADITIRESKEVAPNEQLAGDGFTVRVPDEKLTKFYPKYDYPLKGGVTLRPTQTFLDGVVYFVTPFAPSSAQTTDEALVEWCAVVQKKQLTAEVLEKSRTTFEGRSATRALLRVREDSRYGHLAAVMIVKRESDYIVMCNSYLYGGLWTESRAKEESKAGLKKLAAGTRLTR